MTKITRALLVLSVLIRHAVDSAQLPPEIRLDQLLLRTEQLIESDNLDAAVEAFDEASALAAEHKLELPSDFCLKHGHGSRWHYWRRRKSPSPHT